LSSVADVRVEKPLLRADEISHISFCAQKICFLFIAMLFAYKGQVGAGGRMNLISFAGMVSQYRRTKQEKIIPLNIETWRIFARERRQRHALHSK
jgi:hypothetical protein